MEHRPPIAPEQPTADEPPAPMPRAEVPEAKAFAVEEIQQIFRSPLASFDLVLAQQARLSQTIRHGERPLLLAMALFFTTLLFSLPFGAVVDISRFWRVALLLLGSLAICLPSLAVFSSYLGGKVDVRQHLSLGLVLTGVAALFTFGFFPVLWFLRVTMADDSVLGVPQLSMVLLIVAQFAGVARLLRVLGNLSGVGESYRPVIAGWLFLFSFITYRMAVVLDLVP